MPNDRISELLRDANPVTSDPNRPTDVAWDDIVAAHEKGRLSSTRYRSHVKSSWTQPRRLFAVAAAVILIAGISTLVSVQGSGNAPSLTNAIARAFGVVNANASTSGSFTTVPASPQGSNLLTCPSSQVCYLESTSLVGGNGGDTATTIYRTTDGGTNWTSLTMPSAGSADTALSCSSVSVCSVGFLRAPNSSPSGPFPVGTVQSMLSTADGGMTWTSHVVAIDPVLGVNTAVDALLASAQGQWSQLQCFSAASCIAVALVPSDQPQEPYSGAPNASEFAGVQRTVVMRTDDGGVTWTSIVLPWSSNEDGSPGWSNAQAMVLACASKMNCLGLSLVLHSVVNNAQTSNVKVWRSSDGGATWQSSWAPAPAIASDPTTGLTCPTTLRCYATVQAGTINASVPEVMTTNDGGATWTFANPVAAGNGTSRVLLSSVNCATASTCWTAGEEWLNRAVTSQAAMWATNNSGATWTAVPLPSGLGFIHQVVCNAPSACLAVAQPPFKSGQTAPAGPLPGEILSNQS